MLNRDRALLLKITLCYGIFVVFGSWVPFNFNSLPMSDAIQAFSELKKLDFAIVNRSDWFTNFLLFMPLFYLLLVVSPKQSTLLARTLQILFICGALLCVSIGIEFVQLFLNDRVSSFKDVFAQFLGMLASFVLYLFTRDKFISMVHELNRHGGDNKWITYANATLTVLVIYSVMPLDLSVSPVELFKKWQQGRITLIPFTSIESSLIEWLFGVFSDIFLWGLITWLYVKSSLYTHAQILKRCLFYAVAIELGQLLVLSRYTDTTDIISAFVGIMLALKFFTTPSVSEDENLRAENTQNTTGLAQYAQEGVLVGWCFMLFVFAIYPLELVAGKEIALANWHNFFSMPLETYWREGPLQAVTQLLRKVLLVVPLGILLALVSNKYQFKKETRILGCLCAVMFLFALELLQILIVDKVAVATDVVLNCFGLLIGWKAFQLHSNKSTIDPYAQVPEADHELSGSSAPRQATSQIIRFYPFAVFTLILLALIFVHGDSRTPYNIKELFDPDWVWFSAAMMSLSFLVAFGLPAILLNAAQKYQKTSALMSLLMVLLHTLLVFNLFFITFPNESLYDILGYPTWRDQSHYLELGYRFLGFFLPFSGALFLVNNWLTSSESIHFKTSRLAFTFLYAFIILPISYLVVIVQAGTDNIVELLPNNGHSFKLLFIVTYILLLAYVSAWWVKKAPTASAFNVLGYAIVTLVTAPLGFYLVQNGMQDVIIKYGKVFSGLQFILSPSRESLVSAEQLFLRFSILHFMLLAMLFISGFASRGFTLNSVSLKSKNITNNHNKRLGDVGIK
ncbi:hypothetical protein FX988_01623 [Paraglaciecola mesophila]|uniref:VanZ-like domain-containing protein n=1 Tax=Paraglaciecola mesophila TaxID=197222 RepID=A0A857JLA2_9ALTE|nr:VanZ family protein [Paraglaciecola mesophila]QHJ11394.1 hypothetical protein FX988_01623 [Paraglaciecola mesophila]